MSASWLGNECSFLLLVLRTGDGCYAVRAKTLKLESRNAYTCDTKISDLLKSIFYSQMAVKWGVFFLIFLFFKRFCFVLRCDISRRSSKMAYVPSLL